MCGQFSNRLDTAENVTAGMRALIETYKEQTKKFKRSIVSKRNKINRLAVAIRAECKYFKSLQVGVHRYATSLVNQANKAINEI